MEVKLSHDVLAMPVDCLDADRQGFGNLSIRMALSDIGQHLALTRGQFVAGRGLDLLRSLQEILDQQFGQRRIEEDVAAADRADG